MADPTHFISISDFSPGIFSNQFAGVESLPGGLFPGPQGPASPNLQGSVPGAGRARVLNTFGCYADSTGALTPLPKAQLISELETGGWIEFPGSPTTPSFAQIPDAADLDVTGDLSLAIQIGQVHSGGIGLSRTLLGKWVEAGNQRSYLLVLNANNFLELWWSTDGININVATSTLSMDISHVWIGVTLDVDNGAGGHDVRFWLSIDGHTSSASETNKKWNQHGATVTGSGITSIFSGTAPVQFPVPNVTGTTVWQGGVAQVMIGSGFGPEFRPGGTTVFFFDGTFDLKGVGTAPASFTATTGETVTMTYGSPAAFVNPTDLRSSAPVLPGLVDDDFTPDQLRGVYLLDAALLPNRVGNPGRLAGSQDPYDSFGASLYTLWGYYYDPDHSANYKAFVHGREFRFWVHATDPNTNLFDFFFQRAMEPHPNQGIDAMLLPSASLVPGRFYYGFTTDGIATAAGDEAFRPEWWFPVITYVVGPALYWRRDMAHWQHTTIPASEQKLIQPIYIVGGGGTPGPLYTNYHPSIGVTHGNVCIGMSWNRGDSGLALQPLGTAHQPWYARRGAKNYAFDPTDFTPDQRAMEPWSPTLAITHQGRLVICDRRQAERALGLANSSGAAARVYPIDDLLFFSDLYLPLQNYQATADASVGGITNSNYNHWNAATHNNYNKLPVAEDSVAPIGTIGIVAVDQMLVVKHYGGGALVTGNMANPTIRRLPFIEPTRGLTHFGVQTPLGFVYGSTEGIFLWTGGDSSEKISQQLDGFFWNHVEEVRTYTEKLESVVLNTISDIGEIYSGARGRFGYWNGFVLVPNNFLFDTRNGSWWRLPEFIDLPDEVLALNVASGNVPSPPYNVYVTTGEGSPASPGSNPGRLLAFPYRSSGPLQIGQPRPFVHVFDHDRLSSKYSWQSHPFIESIGTMITVQDVRLYASLKDTPNDQVITISIEGVISGQDTQIRRDVVFTVGNVDDENPIYLYKDVPVVNNTPFQAEYVTIRITTDSGDDFVPAPTIHSVSLGYIETAPLPRNP